MVERKILRFTCLLVSLALPQAFAVAQPKHPSPAAPALAAPAADATGPAPSDKDVAATQRQLIELLRLSPKLTTVVSHDPSLLADQEYVSRNNPQLAAFLTAHPEVARNPDFYLFTHMKPEDGSPDEALERAVWPEVYRMQPSRTGFDNLLSDMAPVFGITIFLGAVVWGLRIFVENRRWSRVFKLQSEVHSRLIDKFSTNQELAAYMETEAGKRFLEASPIPVNIETGQRVPNAVARVLTPIQIGTVMVLLGAGFFLLRHIGPEYEAPMRVLGVVVLMPGIGFILSAGITWVLASRMGLMPPPASHSSSFGTQYPER